MILAAILVLVFSMQVSAQKAKEKPVTDTINVHGNCGMCKENIEGALDIKGIKSADWNKETKQLIVTYLASKITMDAIQHKIADAGYDTEKYKASDKAYNKLHACCQYERGK